MINRIVFTINQTIINTIMNNPDAEGAINSINEKPFELFFFIISLDYLVCSLYIDGVVAK